MTDRQTKLLVIIFIALSFFHSIILFSPSHLFVFFFPALSLPLLFFVLSYFFLHLFNFILFLLISLFFSHFILHSFFLFSCTVYCLQFRRCQQILSKRVLFTCLVCMLVITRLFLVSQVNVAFIINLRTGE